jgi:hypothetical protein
MWNLKMRERERMGEREERERVRKRQMKVRGLLGNKKRTSRGLGD